MIQNYADARQKMINRIKSLEFSINLIIGLTKKERESIQKALPEGTTLHDFIILMAEDFLKWLEKD